MTTLKEFEEALRERGLDAALEVLAKLRERDKANRAIRPARRVVGQRMTPELARRILKLHETTEMTQQEIAFALGVNQGRVNEVIKRGKWLDGDPNAPEAVARDRALERAKRGVGTKPRTQAAPAAARGGEAGTGKAGRKTPKKDRGAADRRPEQLPLLGDL